MTLGIDPEDRIPGAPARPPSKWPRHFGASVRIGVVLVVIGAAAASGWPYIKEHFLTPSPPSGPLPVIGPGDEPIKEAPKQPGGMQVPDQDKIILNGSAAQPKVEQILPPPPTPLPAPPPTTPPAVTQTPPSQASQPGPSVVTTAPPAVSRSTPPLAAADVSPPAPQQPPQAVPATSSPPPPPPPPPARPASIAAANPPASSAPAATVSGEHVPQALAGHGWFVQLGAVGSTSAAQAEWTRLKRTQADLLASLSANAVRVERGGGVIYRIEAGPVANGGAASQLCRSLQQRHVACIVVHP
ncbi:MAG TPA: SPOR domain-containing protein [Stellaceae bacterium]|nr:SPOR domain-containing protein [Stellaceae bacterium]